MSRMFNLKELLEGKLSVALGGHVRPDGDCVGSTMGLYLYLKENFPQIETDLYLESVPEAYSMIRHTDEVKSELPEGKIYDLFICMDCGDLQRLGFSQKLFIESKQTGLTSSRAFCTNPPVLYSLQIFFICNIGICSFYLHCLLSYYLLIFWSKDLFSYPTPISGSRFFPF